MGRMEMLSLREGAGEVATAPRRSCPAYRGGRVVAGNRLSARARSQSKSCAGKMGL